MQDTVLEKEKNEKSRKKPVVRKIIGWLLYLLLVASIVIFTPALLSRLLNTSTPIAAITSSSMWPALKKGDLIFIHSIKPEAIEKGDIIVYTNPRGYTIHRVVNIHFEKNSLTTKGDANNVSDAPITFDLIIGKTLEYKSGNPVRIPKLGYISIWASQYYKKQ